jgi:hypothetical protein
MQTNKFLIILLFFSLLSINKNLFAQESYFSENEKTLKVLFDSLFKRDETRFLRTDIEKKSINDTIQKIFLETLLNKESFNYTFDSLKHIGKIYSKDKLVRTITWNIKFSDGSFKYYGFIQHKNERKNKINSYVLTDKSDSIINPESAVLTNYNWFGALYYSIYDYSVGNKNYYILFGWDGNNYYTNKKIIEILTFNNSGKPIFGKSVFKMDSKMQKRVIFEHSIKASMTCKYNETAEAIVFDHLSPPKSSQKGQYQFYGPDGSFDGLQLIKGKWVLIPEIFVTNPNTKKRKTVTKTP